MNLCWAGGLVLVLAFVLFLLRLLPSVGWPLVLSAILAYLCDPLAEMLVRKGLSRSMAALSILGSGVLLSVGALMALVPLLLTQARSLPGYVRGMLEVLSPKIERLTGFHVPESLRELSALAQTHLQELLTKLLPGAGSAVGRLVGSSIELASGLLGALVIPIIGFLLIRDWPRLLEWGSELVPPRHRPLLGQRMREVDRMLGGFIRGQLTLSAVLSALYALCLGLIGLKLALVVGVITGFGNLIPYIGTSIGVVLAVGFCLVDFGFDHHVLLVALTYVMLGTVEGFVLSPAIVGDRVGLGPAGVIIAVMTFGALFGFAGLLLAVPTAALLKLVLGVVEQGWRQSRLYQPEAMVSSTETSTGP